MNFEDNRSSTPETEQREEDQEATGISEESPFGYIDILSHGFKAEDDPDNPRTLISYEVRKLLVTCGREHINDIRINDGRVSRAHGLFRIQITDGLQKVYFQNLSKKGGTFLNSDVSMNANEEVEMTKERSSVRICNHTLVWRGYNPENPGGILDDTIPMTKLSPFPRKPELTPYVTGHRVMYGVARKSAPVSNTASSPKEPKTQRKSTSSDLRRAVLQSVHQKSVRTEKEKFEFLADPTQNGNNAGTHNLPAAAFPAMDDIASYNISMEPLIQHDDSAGDMQVTPSDSPVETYVFSGSPATCSVQLDPVADASVCPDTPKEVLIELDTPAETSVCSDAPAETSVCSDATAETSVCSDATAGTSICSDAPAGTSVCSDAPAEAELFIQKDLNGSDILTPQFIQLDSAVETPARCDAPVQASEQSDSASETSFSSDISLEALVEMDSSTDTSIPADTVADPCIELNIPPDISSSCIDSHSAPGEASMQIHSHQRTSISDATKTASVELNSDVETPAASNVLTEVSTPGDTSTQHSIQLNSPVPVGAQVDPSTENSVPLGSVEKNPIQLDSLPPIAIETSAKSESDPPANLCVHTDPYSLTSASLDSPSLTEATAPIDSLIETNMSVEPPAKTKAQSDVFVGTSTHLSHPVKIATESDVPVGTNVQVEFPLETNIRLDQSGDGCISSDAPIEASVKLKLDAEVSGHSEILTPQSDSVNLMVKSPTELDIAERRIQLDTKIIPLSETDVIPEDSPAAEKMQRKSGVQVTHTDEMAEVSARSTRHHNRKDIAPLKMGVLGKPRTRSKKLGNEVQSDSQIDTVEEKNDAHASSTGKNRKRNTLSDDTQIIEEPSIKIRSRGKKVKPDVNVGIMEAKSEPPVAPLLRQKRKSSIQTKKRGKKVKSDVNIDAVQQTLETTTMMQGSEASLALEKVEASRESSVQPKKRARKPKADVNVEAGEEAVGALTIRESKSNLAPENVEVANDISTPVKKRGRKPKVNGGERTGETPKLRHNTPDMGVEYVETTEEPSIQLKKRGRKPKTDEHIEAAEVIAYTPSELRRSKRNMAPKKAEDFKENSISTKEGREHKAGVRREAVETKTETPARSTRQQRKRNIATEKDENVEVPVSSKSTRQRRKQNMAPEKAEILGETSVKVNKRTEKAESGSHIEVYVEKEKAEAETSASLTRQRRKRKVAPETAETFEEVRIQPKKRETKRKSDVHNEDEAMEATGEVLARSTRQLRKRNLSPGIAVKATVEPSFPPKKRSRTPKLGIHYVEAVEEKAETSVASTRQRRKQNVTPMEIQAQDKPSVLLKKRTPKLVAQIKVVEEDAETPAASSSRRHRRIESEKGGPEEVKNLEHPSFQVRKRGRKPKSDVQSEVDNESKTKTRPMRKQKKRDVEQFELGIAEHSSVQPKQRGKKRKPDQTEVAVEVKVETPSVSTMLESKQKSAPVEVQVTEVSSGLRTRGRKRKSDVQPEIVAEKIKTPAGSKRQRKKQ